MRKATAVLLSLFMIFSLTLTACAAEETTEINAAPEIVLTIGSSQMNVNGVQKPIDEQGTVPVIINGRTLLPVRAAVEEMGGTVEWNDAAQEVKLKYGSDEIRLTIDSQTAYLNNNAQSLDTAPVLMNDRTMLPIRFIAEGFNFKVLWDAAAQTVTITKNTDSQVTSNKKALVVYYSATGSTEKVANYIKDSLNADIFKLEPVNEYSSADLNWTDSASRVNKEHDDESKRDITLKSINVPNWDEYDTVFIGYPIWWGIAAWPVNSFVKENDFSEKTVIPFCSSARSPLGESGMLLSEMSGTGVWQNGMRFRSGASESDVKNWLNEINAGEFIK